MPLEDEKIKALVHTTDNIKEAQRMLRNSLSPMGRAGYSLDEMAALYEKLVSIGAKLDSLQKEILAKIYK